jgi:hypothetical protein
VYNPAKLLHCNIAQWKLQFLGVSDVALHSSLCNATATPGNRNATEEDRRLCRG